MPHGKVIGSGTDKFYAYGDYGHSLILGSNRAIVPVYEGLRKVYVAATSKDAFGDAGCCNHGTARDAPPDFHRKPDKVANAAHRWNFNA